MVTFEELLSKALDRNPGLDRERLTRAFRYAEAAHENQYRMSGDPYIVHILEVLNILLDLKPDEDTIVAAMLHGLPSIESYDKKEIKALFGDKVLFLINALESLQRVKSRDENAETENIRKLFVTMAQDIRVVLIKMADRLHNMETLSFRSVQKQKLIARETMEVYVPISARLSIYSLKGKLEDWAFQYLYPRQYEMLKAELDEYLAERKHTVEDSIKELESYLQEHGYKVKVDGRVKNLYSIYRKLKAKNGSVLKDLYDVYAIRVIVDDKYDKQGHEMTDHIYTILGLIHSKWKPLGYRFKDYIAIPKPNGYQSLHTAIVGLSASSQPTEIQIRSKKMHEEAEYGIASHWIYDEGKKKKGAKKDDKGPERMEWVEALSAIQSDTQNDDLIHHLKLDVFSDRIFVMTPTGEVKDLPKGSTPVDFAYSIHSDIGHRCKLAKVNDMVVSLDYELKNGETVEIMLGKKFDPKPLWLSFVKTQGAKSKIRAYFRSLDKESIVRKGKELINEELSKLGKPHLDENLRIFKEYNGRRLPLREREGLIEEVGNGSVDAIALIKNIFGEEIRSKRRHASVKRVKKGADLPKKSGGSHESDQICIAGESDLPYRIGHCCNPKKGMPIVGYVTRGHTITIHLQQCKLLRTAKSERVLEATWGKGQKLQRYSVKLRLKAQDRVGLLRDIADVITKMNINIQSFSESESNENEIERELVVDITNDSQLEKLMDRLEQVRNVDMVTREDGL
ncbi:MAG: RelA/SpoT family protein [Candidatus Gracilibacteria bacterium]